MQAVGHKARAEAKVFKPRCSSHSRQEHADEDEEGGIDGKHDVVHRAPEI